jgi:hypothetical protein
MALWEQHFAALIAAERDHMMRHISELIEQARKEISVEIETAYKKAFDPLRLDIDALKHELRKLSGGPSGEPVELPNPSGARIDIRESSLSTPQPPTRRG